MRTPIKQSLNDGENHKMNAFKNKKTLIIGGAGFIGSHLADFLSESTKKLVIVDAFIENSGANEKNLSVIQSKNIPVIRKNLHDIESWGEIIADMDLIFNLASLNAHKESMQNPFLDYQRNAAVHLNFIRYCRSLNRPLKIIFTSTRSVYGAAGANPAKETAQTQPRDFYSLHTLLAEHYYRLSGHERISVCCVRFSNTFGPKMRLRGTDIGLFGELLKSALTGHPMEIYGTGETLRDTLFVDNLIEGLALIAEKHQEPFSVVNLGGIGISILQFAKAIQNTVPDASVDFKPLPEHLKSIQVGDVILDNTLAVQEYHWTPKLNLNQAVRQTIAFYKNNREFYL